MLALAGVLAGCGFHLRGAPQYGFDTIAVNPDTGNAVGAALVRQLGSRVRPLHQAPEVVLDLLGEQRQTVIVGVNSSGQVRELQLRMQVAFRLRTQQGRELIGATSLAQQRELSFNETVALAKEAEQAALFKDMQDDLVQQILRRVAAAR